MPLTEASVISSAFAALGLGVSHCASSHLGRCGWEWLASSPEAMLKLMVPVAAEGHEWVGQFVKVSYSLL